MDSILIIDSINPPNGLITNNSGTTIIDCNIPIDVIASGGVFIWGMEVKHQMMHQIY